MKIEAVKITGDRIRFPPGENCISPAWAARVFAEYFIFLDSGQKTESQVLQKVQAESSRGPGTVAKRQT